MLVCTQAEAKVEEILDNIFAEQARRDERTSLKIHKLSVFFYNLQREGQC